jgi:putative ABC transport system permease protein
MIKNSFTIAVRNLLRRKGYALINISGLVIGMACCLLIFCYVAYEKSYEDFNKNASRIYRIQDEEYEKGVMVVPCASAMPGVAPFMIREFPEVENACRLNKQNFLLGNETRNMHFREQVWYADPSVTDIFQLRFLSGDSKTALSVPGKVILSQEKATNFFGNENPIGKTLKVYNAGSVKALEVTGVFRDYPSNSHIHLDILVSYTTYSVVNGTYGTPNDVLETNFGWTDFYTYILLRKNSDPGQLEAKLPAFIDRHFNDLPENKSRHERYTLSMMPMQQIHLYSHYTEEAEANGDAQSVNFLLIIALFILVIAWINYINLSTARSVERAREVGMRKVLGALRSELIRQFLLESLLMNLVSLAVAVLLTFSLYPIFSHFTGRPLGGYFSLPPVYLAGFVLLFVGGTLLSGIYPALVLSRYKPVLVLKGAFKNTAGGLLLRKGLIVGQFAASVMLIAATIIIYRQVNFMRNKDLGINIAQMIVIKGPGDGSLDSVYRSRFASFKQDVLRTNGVNMLSASSEVPGNEILWSTTWHRMHLDYPQSVNLFHLGIDDDFIKTYGLKVIAGAGFSTEPGVDHKAVMLNETATRALGYVNPNGAVGDLVSAGPGWGDSSRVIGVLADYHNEGLQKAIQPLIFFPNADGGHDYSLKIDGKKASGLIASIKTIWQDHFPSSPFEYFFLDEHFAKEYAENEKFGEVFGLFSILAIGIACFGLFGLASYNVVQRTKEIGIRKVLGASIGNLVVELSKDFLVLVVLSILIAVPVTWMIMTHWLEDFVYRLPVSWVVFVFSAALTLLAGLLTVGSQAVKAARANAVKNLRSE